MPYIKQEARSRIADQQSLGLPDAVEVPDAGALNYLFTRLAQSYLLEHGLRYQTINDIVGALEGAKLELYRRVAAPYEDQKIKENGDVYA